MTDFKVEFEHLYEQLERDGVPGLVPKPTAPAQKNWTEQTLDELQLTSKFPEAIRARVARYPIISKFFRFYFSGMVGPGDTVAATVYSAASLITCGDEPIFKDEDYSPEGFFHTNAPDIVDLSTVQCAEIAAPVLTGLSEELKKEYETKKAAWSLTAATTMRDKIQSFIKDHANDAAASPEELIFTRVCAYLALTLCRAATKTVGQLGNTFLKASYLQNAHALIGIPDDWEIQPPAQLALEKCVRHLCKGLPNTGPMFVRIVYAYRRIILSHNPDQRASAILSASVLTHTARNGLGLIQLVEQASDSLKCQWKDLMRYSALNTTIEGWKAIGNAMIDFYGDNRTEITYSWARVINDGYLRGLAPKEHPFLGFVLLSILEIYQGEGVWNSEWAKSQKATFAAAINYGKAVQMAMRPTLENASAYGPSVAVLDIAKGLGDDEINNTDLANQVQSI